MPQMIRAATVQDVRNDAGPSRRYVPWAWRALASPKTASNSAAEPTATTRRFVVPDAHPLGHAPIARCPLSPLTLLANASDAVPTSRSVRRRRSRPRVADGPSLRAGVGRRPRNRDPRSGPSLSEGRAGVAPRRIDATTSATRSDSPQE
jgi:hypothetical protein